MGRRIRCGICAVAMLSWILVPSQRPSAASPAYPDLQAFIIASSLKIAQPTPTTRELQYTHRIADLGDGPLEIRPVYNPATDMAQGFQEIYSRTSGSWTLVGEVPIVGQFYYHAAHGHYHFPLAYYGIHAVNADGSVGAPLAVATKVGYCIADDVVQDSTLPNYQPYQYAGWSCSYPTMIRGINVGWADVYDSTDAGQSIDITNLPNGTYWFRTIVDPYNYLLETDETNNITDLQLQISGTSVTLIGNPAHPNSRPPTVTLTAPGPSTIAGTVTLSAGASDATGIASVQFLVDGSPIGTARSAPPYTMAWDSTTIANGVHYLSAQALAGSTMYGTAPAVVVTVSNNGTPPPPPPPPPPSGGGALAVDQTVSIDAIGTATTPAFSTTSSSEVLVALVSSDGPLGSTQTAAVTGGSLTWNLVARANTQHGDAEIWQAVASAPLVNARISSQQAFATFRQSLTVVTFVNASGVGASAGGGAASGAPTLSLTTQAGSFVYGAGNDWDHASPRIVGAQQAIVHQFLDSATDDALWSQSLVGPTAGGPVQVNDTQPTTDRWNFAAVEILATSSAPPPVAISDVLVTNRTATSALVTWTTNVAASSSIVYGLTSTYGSSVIDATPTTTHALGLSSLTPQTTYHYQLSSQDGAGNVARTADFVFTTAAVSQISCSIIAPASGSTVGGVVTVSANAGSTASIAGVQFQVDGVNLGAEVGGNQTPPYSTTWDTTAASNGAHTVSALVRDPTANTATCSIPVVVSNTPVAGIAVDQVVSSDGSGTRTTPPFTTTAPGEVLVAFAASDGPQTGAQSLTVSGAGLTWTLVRRANTQLGTAEIWTATASSVLTNATVQSVQGIAGFRQSLTVVTFAGASGIGASAAAGDGGSAPSISLSSTASGSVVYGIGYDWDNAIARTLGPNQTLVHEWVDTAIGDTAWVVAQSSPVVAPGTLVVLNATAPTGDRWNLAAVEIVR